MTQPPAIHAVSFVLAHVPDLVRYGSKPRREIARSAEFEAALVRRLRDEEGARDYLPNRVFLGEIDPDALREIPRPWWNEERTTQRPGAITSSSIATALRAGRVAAPSSVAPGLRAGRSSAKQELGAFLGQAAAYAALADADRFDLLLLEERFAASARASLLGAGLWSQSELTARQTASVDEIERLVESEHALPLWTRDTLAGCMRRADEADATLAADVLLENLAAKATAAAAVRHLLAPLPDESRDEIEYVIGCGEEAVGDRYQRGGGSLGKAIAEQAGLTGCTGCDVKAFCCGPVHALVTAGALVQAGVFRRVLVVGGGSLAKLGMKSPAHLRAGMPILEDVLAAFAILVGPHDGLNPVLRLDAVGRHDIGHGSAAQHIAEALTVTPLAKLGRRLIDVDKFAVELHNPEVTEPSGSGDVPRNNYRLIASLAARHGLIARDAIGDFEVRHGLVGFAPTQGHVASAIPYLGHAWRRMRAGTLDSTLFIAKGSLFLGRMTQMADGISVLVERP